MRNKYSLFFLLFFSGLLLYYFLFVRVSPETKNRLIVEQELSAALDQAEAMWVRPALMEGAGRDFTRLDEDEILLSLRLRGELSESDGKPILLNDHAAYSVMILSPESLMLEATPSAGSEKITVTLWRSDGVWIREPDF